MQLRYSTYWGAKCGGLGYSFNKSREMPQVRLVGFSNRYAHRKIA